MSSTPIIPLAQVMSTQPDSNWEYLDTVVKPYTIDLVTQYRNACLFAVNDNVIRFHPQPQMLNSWIEPLLTLISEAEKAIPAIHLKHAGRAGYALGAADIAPFLAIHEEYVLIQSNMLTMYNTHFVPLLQSNEQAHARATAAQAKQKENG